MKTSRRQFIKVGALGSMASAAVLQGCGNESEAGASPPPSAAPATRKPIVVSTWEHGVAANAAAWAVLEGGGRALDAVEAGVRVTEADPEMMSVGYGGRPDRQGHVTLDACIMDERGDCGAVAFLEEIMHPISVARKVMENTPHVMLVGQGAQDFAVAEGFPRENLLTPAAEAEWRKWLESDQALEKATINVENHDTIGMVALDADGNLSGACTTSGAAYKMHGRVGDSPLIGAGLFVDNAVGAACATGWGEAVVRIVGCHLVVEFMRQGLDPEAACRAAVERVIEKNPDWREIQVGFLALNKAGEYGSFCIQPDFNFAVQHAEGSMLLDAPSQV